MLMPSKCCSSCRNDTDILLNAGNVAPSPHTRLPSIPCFS
uniref:Uncharacterized protein n=1 Tax=Arundo donax TaxID=35708 RepID=A0A0A9E3S3_ARUDO